MWLEAAMELLVDQGTRARQTLERATAIDGRARSALERLSASDSAGTLAALQELLATITPAAQTRQREATAP